MEFQINKSTSSEIKGHLELCDEAFSPKLSSYVDIIAYSEKLYAQARRFELWKSNELIGLLAFYENVDREQIYISNLSLLSSYRGKEIASRLLDLLLAYGILIDFKSVSLEVRVCNERAKSFYFGKGFKKTRIQEDVLSMSLNLD
jgi:ribosomal protein S18 acetylase RimI-like enzyme